MKIEDLKPGETAKVDKNGDIVEVFSAEQTEQLLRDFVRDKGSPREVLVPSEEIHSNIESVKLGETRYHLHIDDLGVGEEREVVFYPHNTATIIGIWKTEPDVVITEIRGSSPNDKENLLLDHPVEDCIRSIGTLCVGQGAHFVVRRLRKPKSFRDLNPSFLPCSLYLDCIEAMREEDNLQ